MTAGVVILVIFALLIVVWAQCHRAHPDRCRFDEEGRDRLGPGFELEWREDRSRRW